MAAECAKQKWNGGPITPPNKQKNNNNNKNSIWNRHHQHKAKDVFVELSRAGYEAAHVLALQQRMSHLRDRLEALEKHAHQEKVKQNKFVLRELVKEARARILEVNGIPAPSSKQTWKYCLHNLTPQQLQHAHVNLKLWPEIVEILSPSAVKLNDWVHGYTTWQAARVIQGMNSTVQSTWGELFKVTHRGESFENYATMAEPSMAEELQEQE